MAQYTNLNAPPERTLREIIDEKIQTRRSATGAAGVKDLGLSGDVVWPRQDGTATSVRDVDRDLADARQRLEEAETSLTDTGSRLTAAEQAVQDVRDELANIEVGEGGPLIHDRIPAPSDGEGKPAGTAWLVYGQDGTLTSVWQWDGTVWEEMPLDATLIPVLDIGSGTFGDLAGSRLTVDDTLAARVVQAMSAEVKELVVTESAILNHATLIGQTVVDDINVQGKLIGTDGVFTGTVDFANVNVTGELLADRIKGKTIEGVELIGASVEAANEDYRIAIGPEAVRFRSDADGGLYRAPGVSISNPQGDGASVSLEAIDYWGGEGVTTAGLVARDENGWKLGAEVYVSDGGIAGLSGADGAKVSASASYAGLIHGATSSTRSYLYVSGQAADSSIKGETPGGVTLHGGYRKNGYSLHIEPDGVRLWRRNSAGAYLEHRDLWKAASYMVDFPYSSLWYMGDSPTKIMVTETERGKFCQARARIQNLSGSSLSLPRQSWITLNLGPIPAALRGGATDYIEVRMPQGDARGLVEMAYSINRLRLKSLESDISWTTRASIWFDMQWFVPN